MKDRIPKYPGRVKLTPVAGQANVYDMVRADEPVEDGTPLNKATLLTDQTAAKYGKTNTAVPDNILDVLSKGVLADSSTEAVLTNVLGEELKGVLKTVTGSYTGTGTDTPLTLEFPLKLRYLVIVGADQRYQAQYMVTDIPTIYGEYIYTIDFGSSSLIKGSSSVVATATASGSTITIQKPDTAKLNQSNAAYQYLAIGVSI